MPQFDSLGVLVAREDWDTDEGSARNFAVYQRDYWKPRDKYETVSYAQRTPSTNYQGPTQPPTSTYSTPTPQKDYSISDLVRKITPLYQRQGIAGRK